MEPILVFGHRNPDNDSVSAAVAYAHLKNVTDPDNIYVPARLGTMPKESAWVFDTYGIEIPAQITNIADFYATAPKDGEKHKVILVDHNETKQSAPDICDAQVVEIIDHHRISDVQTSAPITFINLPIGSSASIVKLCYEYLDVELPTPLAAVLLSAVLTDTVMLKSPTATNTDAEIVAELADIVGVDPMEFGMAIFHARSAGEEFDSKKLFSRDAKEFAVGDSTVLIAQYETVDKNEVMPHLEDLIDEAGKIRDEHDYALVLLMITDIMEEGSEILVVGNKEAAETALGISFNGPTVWMPGVLSRKKQIAAKIVECDL